MKSPRTYWHLLKAKMVRDPLPPEDVAAGWALGMFIGCAVPFGLQLIVSIPLALMMRVSKVGATLGTLVTNPVSIFVIYPAQTWAVNRLLFGGSANAGGIEAFCGHPAGVTVFQIDPLGVIHAESIGFIEIKAPDAGRAARFHVTGFFTVGKAHTAEKTQVIEAKFFTVTAV